MMVELHGLYRAQRIADMVPAVVRDRLEHHFPQDWTKQESYDDFAAMLRSMESWTEGPDWNKVVVVGPRMRPAGDCWSHTSAEILDRAADRVDAEVGDSYTFHHGVILPGADGHSYESRLVFRHKPNLDRLYEYDEDLDGCTLRPMISFLFGGRRFYLAGEDLDLPRMVATRYPLRHVNGTYGRRVQEFAARLSDCKVKAFAGRPAVALEDARRIADILCPGRHGIDEELNPAIRILSIDEERAVRDGADVLADDPAGCPECHAHPGEPCRGQNCQGAWQ